MPTHQQIAAARERGTDVHTTIRVGQQEQRRPHCLSGIYRDPNKISTTLKPKTLLSSPLGHHLNSTTEPLRNNDRLSSYL